MRPRWLAVVLISVLLSAWGRGAVAAPEDRGPYPVEGWDAGDVSAAGVNIPTKVYYGTGTATTGALVAVMHGNFRSGDFHLVLAETLASRGFVVVLPDMPCGFGGCDHTANARQLSALLAWATEAAATPGTPIFGRINQKRGLVGHSYGALAAFLATARNPQVDVAVLLDPKDDLGAAENEQPNVMVPSAHLIAEVLGACNGGWDTLVFPKTAPPHLLLRVAGSAHCDVEEPSDSLCPAACGQGDPAKSKIFRRYTVSFLSCVLNAETSAGAYVGGPSLADDQASGTVDHVQAAGLASLPCRAGIPDPVDAGVSTDGGGPSESEDGCGCRATPSPSVPLGSAVLTLGLALLWRSRSRGGAGGRARRGRRRHVAVVAQPERLVEDGE